MKLMKRAGLTSILNAREGCWRVANGPYRFRTAAFMHATRFYRMRAQGFLSRVCLHFHAARALKVFQSM
jgi:hypothetical protein